MIKVEKLNPFGRMCISLGMLPSSYKESLTYEEQLLWFFKYLDETVIPTLNNNADAIEEVQELYLQIKEYVDNYFENLDVQEEINNKLDDMALSGELQEIIDSYLSIKALIVFDNVASMKSSTNLVDGSYAKTLGYYSVGDGGESVYKIITKTTEIPNEMDIISISDTLIAVLVINNQTINIKQFGAVGDGVSDDTSILNYALSLSSLKVKKICVNEKYLISNTLVFTSNKDLIGVKSNLQFNEYYQPMFISNSDIVMCNISNLTNIKIENVNFVHPVTNTSSVIDFSKTRYLKLKNIQIYHEGTTKSNNIALNDTISESSTGFSGYIQLENVRASYYKISLKSKATFIEVKNCVFNNANDYNIHFLGEVLGIEDSDISYSTSGKAIKTESEYDLNIINSYLEGFYQDRCFEKTHNININLKGSKFYIANGVTSASGKRMEYTDEYPQPLRNTLNDYQAGNPSNVNLIPNGKFDKGSFGWTFSNDNLVIMNKSELTEIGVPHYIQNVLKVQNGNFYTNINESMNVGDYITIGYWVYIPNSSVANPYINVVDQNNQNEIVNDRPNQRDKWVYYTTYAKISEALTNGFRLRISYGELMYITGITLKKGMATDIDYEYTPNSDNIVTDNMIIKGTNNKYYKLVYDGSNLSFTETNTI